MTAKFRQPHEFASRIGRTISIHISRNDWRQVQHTLRAAQREQHDFENESQRLRQLTPEQRAAETLIADCNLQPRLSNALAEAGFLYISDLLIARPYEIRELLGEDLGKQSMADLQNLAVRFGGTLLLEDTQEDVSTDATDDEPALEPINP